MKNQEKTYIFMFIRLKIPQKDVIENPRTLTAHDRFDNSSKMAPGHLSLQTRLKS